MCFGPPVLSRAGRVVGVGSRDPARPLGSSASLGSPGSLDSSGTLGSPASRRRSRQSKNAVRTMAIEPKARPIPRAEATDSSLRMATAEPHQSGMPMTASSAISATNEPRPVPRWLRRVRTAWNARHARNMTAAQIRPASGERRSSMITPQMRATTADTSTQKRELSARSSMSSSMACQPAGLHARQTAGGRQAVPGVRDGLPVLEPGNPTRMSSGQADGIDYPSWGRVIRPAPSPRPRRQPQAPGRPRVVALAAPAYFSVNRFVAGAPTLPAASVAVADSR